MTASEQQALFDAAKTEVAIMGDVTIRIDFDVGSLIGLIGQLQLALRHPGNTGPTGNLTRGLVAKLIEHIRRKGFPRCAEIAELGNDPQYDTPPHDLKGRKQ